MPDSSQLVLRTMLIHLCDIDKLAQSAATASSYGHNRIVPTSVATAQNVYSDIQGRLYPLSALEQQMQQTQGQVVADFYYYVINQDLVAELQENMTASVRYQLRNVRLKKGTVIRPGPYDINEVVDETGEGHHWRLTLRRVA